VRLEGCAGCRLQPAARTPLQPSSWFFILQLEIKFYTVARKLWYRYHPGMIRSSIIQTDEGDTTVKNVAFRDATSVSLPHYG
jgi:hypothetical protein